jgi:hypothetical protein
MRKCMHSGLESAESSGSLAWGVRADLHAWVVSDMQVEVACV